MILLKKVPEGMLITAGLCVYSTSSTKFLRLIYRYMEHIPEEGVRRKQEGFPK